MTSPCDNFNTQVNGLVLAIACKQALVWDLVYKWQSWEREWQNLEGGDGIGRGRDWRTCLGRAVICVSLSSGRREISLGER